MIGKTWLSTRRRDFAPPTRRSSQRPTMRPSHSIMPFPSGRARPGIRHGCKCASTRCTRWGPSISREHASASPLNNLADSSFPLAGVWIERLRIASLLFCEPALFQGLGGAGTRGRVDRQGPSLRQSRARFVTAVPTTLDLYTQGDGDEARAAQGAFLREMGLASELVQ